MGAARYSPNAAAGQGGLRGPDVHGAPAVGVSAAARVPRQRAPEQDYLAARGLNVVLIGSRGYPSTYGGFETFVRRLAPWLVRRGHDVAVYGHGRPGRRWLHSVDLEGVEARTTHGLPSASLSTLTYGLTACLDAAGRRPDVALLMNVANGFYLPALRARGIPTAVNVDGIEWERGKWGRAARQVFQAGAGWTARFADAIVVDSTAIGDHWRERFGRDSVFIPYGADTVLPTGGAPLSLPPRGYVLGVARLVPENNIDLLLDVAERLPGTPVVFVGDSATDSDLRRRMESASTRGVVRWLGHVRDQELLTQLWAHCGAYFHGHSAGGTNPSLLQAMAARAPVVAFDTVYNREVLGPGAPMVDRDPDRAARVMSSVLADRVLQSALVERQLHTVRERYSWDSVNHAYESLLVSLARRAATA